MPRLSRLPAYAALPVLAALSLLATPAIAQSGAGGSGETLSAEEIRQEMLGKTIETQRFGVTVTLVYRDDGTVSADAPIGAMEGTWEMQGNEVCTTFPSGPAEGTQCVSFTRTGPNSYVNSNGQSFTVTG